MTRSTVFTMAMHAFAVVLSIAGLIVCINLLTGCGAAATSARAASYETELVICNQKAKTLKESIDCENDVRGRYGRPARPYPASVDGGTQ